MDRTDTALVPSRPGVVPSSGQETIVHREIACREIVEIITSYLEGVLPEDRADEVEQHLLTCPGCIAYLKQMRTPIATAGALTVDDVPEPVMEELLAAFRDLIPPR